MFKTRSTEDCDQEDDLLDEFLNSNDKLTSVSSNGLIDNLFSKQIKSNESTNKLSNEIAASTVSTNRLNASNKELYLKELKDELKNNLNDVNKANELSELNHLFDNNDDDNQYFSNLINEQILNSKVSSISSFYKSNYHCE